MLPHGSNKNFNQEPDLEHIQDVCSKAALASMQLVRQYQLGIYTIGASVLKPADKTLVTQVDILSEKAARQVLSRGLPELTVIGEELGGEDTTGERFIWLDPIDGTKPFVAGAPTSTVMVGVYNKLLGQVEAATIGQPATGMVWQTLGGKAIKRLFDLNTGHPLTDAAECRVWSGGIQHKSVVFVDGSRGFIRNGRQIMDERQTAALHAVLQPIADTQNYGSNGMHQALVANGGEFVTGSITTHMGGPWDTLGARLVMEAGGAATGLRVECDRTLVAEDPLNPENYDMLITANNPESMEALVDSVNRAWTA